MIITVNAQVLRAAMQCQGKKDVRYYLNGILFAENGDLVATNGHVLFKSTYLSDDQIALESPLILAIDGTIPVSADTVTIDLDPYSAIPESAGTARTNTGKVFNVGIQEGTYPDYMRVIPSQSQLLSNSPLRCFDTSYLALIEKVYGKGNSAIIETWDENNPAMVTCPQFQEDPDAILIVMPQRIDKDIEPKLARELPSRDRRAFDELAMKKSA